MVDQPSRQPVGALGELGVGQALPVELDSDAVGVPPGGGAEQIGEGPRLRRVPAAPVHEVGALGVAEERKIADGGLGSLDRCPQDADQAVAERLDGRLVEEIGGVGEDGFGADLGVLAHRELEIDVGRVGRDVDGLDVQPRHLEARRGLGLQCERHLEQRRMRGGARDVENLDQLLERDLGVLEGREVRGADLSHERIEALVRTHPGAQHERVDEHADQVVERTRATTADGGADSDVRGTRQPGQDGRIGGVQDHERRDAPGAGVRADRGVELGADRGAMDGAAHRLHLRAFVIGGQFEAVGQPGEGLAPVIDLGGGH
ncbi:hypothetical protein GCM10009855_08290 [Gordonia cholesterolivorans]|uniref:Uncharacterized protein n=1 Tax=Gordonia cholesterolivorans TaxID=559625 RepID=A0ABP5U7Z7_9ACTN